MSGFLVLESGEVFSGLWHGGENRIGEVVFNTSHSGYEEIATDPSYYKQIVVMTAPMQGNYGESNDVWESRQFWIEGFICVQIQDSQANKSWLKKLIQAKVPVVSDLDTRRLVLRLRSGGTPWGALVNAESEAEAQKIASSLLKARHEFKKDWVWEVSRKTPEVQKGENPKGPRLAVLDFGSKENILRELRSRVSELHILPSRATKEEILAVKADALILTNGPGDPADVEKSADTVKSLIGQIPLFGICMGHQILALAMGGETYKMKFGHRGSNHPVKDEILNQIYMTSQNHGYAVKDDSLPSWVKVTHRNLNDQTVAGFYSADKKILGIQYHPESCPGPHDSQGLFTYFIEQLARN